MTPRMIVVPLWKDIFESVCLVGFVLATVWLLADYRTRIVAAESKLTEARAETVACHEQLSDAVAYSARISDRLDRIADLLAEGL
jgi:hypothetical protein